MMTQSSKPQPRNFRILSDEEHAKAGELKQGRAINVHELAADIYTVTASGILAHPKDGDLEISRGMKLKVVDGDLLKKYAGAEWLYTVKKAMVTIPGSKKALELKTGIQVSVLPKDYKELLKKKQEDDAAGDTSS